MKKEINQFFKLHPKCNEVDLFRHTSKYLSKKYKTTFIEESHQCYIEFSPTNPKCKIKKKEISDLWIIVYSPKEKKGKMTFLQAKYKKNKKAIPKPFRFSADYFQYDLLKHRPIIRNISKLNLPSNILSSAKYNSIGSYGVYYYDKNKLLDFSFSVASDLIFKTKAKCNTGTRTLFFEDDEYYIVRNINNHIDFDLRNTLNADTFECALINLMIGSPFENDNKLLAFLKKKFQNINGADDFNTFLSLFETNSQDTDIKDNHMNQNILLINIDEKE